MGVCWSRVPCEDRTRTTPLSSSISVLVSFAFFPKTLTCHEWHDHRSVTCTCCCEMDARCCAWVQGDVQSAQMAGHTKLPKRIEKAGSAAPAIHSTVNAATVLRSGYYKGIRLEPSAANAM